MSSVAVRFRARALWRTEQPQWWRSARWCTIRLGNLSSGRGL